MKYTCFDRGWQLSVLNPLTLRLGEKTPVELPHDYSITQKMDPSTYATSSNAYLPGGVIEYEKVFTPEDARRAVLLFEGVYMNATVCLNGHIIGRQPYGYSSFLCDMTPQLLMGKENTLTVRVNNSALPNSRWYSGMGIYRHVWLLTGGDCCIRPWGVFVSTPVAAEDEAIFEIETTVQGAAQGITLFQRLLNPDGTEAGSSTCTLDTEEKLTQSIPVSSPRLWSPDSPSLYTLVTELRSGEDILDRVTTETGVRSVEAVPGQGLKLNGRIEKLKGGCVHHDCGLLGAAAYDRAEERKVELLKASGFNAVRCAHNPPSPAFLAACDRLGLWVIDEAFDCWRVSKMANDYSLYFDDWWERDIEAMVLRDRNHPSIILWSTGNEIPERNGRSGGADTARRLCDGVRRLDKTRPLTNALCGLWGVDADLDWADVTEGFAAPLDVAGYNYLPERYEEDLKRFPSRLICGTETYPKDAFEYWELTQRLPGVIGDFVWTALDYLGEAGIGRVVKSENEAFTGAYPWSHANCGDIDLCGRKRPQSYYRDCVWGHSQAPAIAVCRPQDTGKQQNLTRWGYEDLEFSWNWPGHEGEAVRVDVYSTCEAVELSINGRSLGEMPCGRANRYTASFTLPYEPGTLTATAKTGGKPTASATLKTPGKPAKLILTPDRALLDKGFSDLCYVDITLADAQGNIVDHTDPTVYLTASGSGSLIAIGSSNPCTDEKHTDNACKLFRGQAMAILRSNGEAGSLMLCAAVDGLAMAQAQVRVK